MDIMDIPLELICTVCAAIAAVANVWIAITNRRLKEQQAKRAAIARLLQCMYGSKENYQSIANSLSEIPIVFSDTPKVLEIRARVRESRQYRKTQGQTAKNDIIVLMDKLLEAMCKSAGLKYKKYSLMEPFAAHDIMFLL